MTDVNADLLAALKDTTLWLDRMDFDMLSRCGIRRQMIEEVCGRAHDAIEAAERVDAHGDLSGPGDDDSEPGVWEVAEPTGIYWQGQLL